MVATRLYTAEDLEALPEDEDIYELYSGERHEVAAVGGRHGEIAYDFGWEIGAFVRERRLGRLYNSDTRFVLARNPDVVVKPDVAFVRTDRIPPIAERIASMPIPPDLAIEINSTGDTAREIAHKVGLYVAAGVPMTVVVEQNTRSLIVHRPGQPPERLGEADTFDGGDVLPGFRLAVADLFR